tara:strand:- start:3376 stop:3942 length:567 start_codon:yes stop_codon:yes gene_type:complete
MALIDRVRERTGSDLSDVELQSMIDAITAEIDARLGPAGPITVTLGDASDPDSRYRRSLRLTRPADPAQAMTIVESDPGNSGDPAAQTALTADDFAVLHSGRTLMRLPTGPNGRTYWAPMVRVTYSPVSDQALRDEATIKLIALDLSYRGALKSERAGDYSFTLSGDPAADRAAILDALAPKGGMVMA